MVSSAVPLGADVWGDGGQVSLGEQTPPLSSLRRRNQGGWRRWAHKSNTTDRKVINPSVKFFRLHPSINHYCHILFFKTNQQQTNSASTLKHVSRENEEKWFGPFPSVACMQSLQAHTLASTFRPEHFLWVPLDPQSWQRITSNHLRQITWSQEWNGTM